MYATVKELHDDAVLLEVAPGVHAMYAKNAIGAVLDDDEYNRIVHGDDAARIDDPIVPDDASSLTGTTESDDAKIDLGKKPEADAADEAGAKDADADATDTEPKDGKADGEK